MANVFRKLRSVVAGNDGSVSLIGLARLPSWVLGKFLDMVEKIAIEPVVFNFRHKKSLKSRKSIKTIVSIFLSRPVLGALKDPVAFKGLVSENYENEQETLLEEARRIIKGSVLLFDTKRVEFTDGSGSYIWHDDIFVRYKIYAISCKSAINTCEFPHYTASFAQYNSMML